tara:strand:- start:980 stop:1105 length:126 start_codon:yes stop_codon:yes gene_type:complete
MREHALIKTEIKSNGSSYASTKKTPVKKTPTLSVSQIESMV